MAIPTPYQARRKALIVAIEGTYGTDATPTAADVVEAWNVDFSPLEADLIEPPPATPYMGAGPTFIAGLHVRLSFEVPIQGGGTAGVAPAVGPLLRACGLAETVVADTSVTYDPVSTGFEGCTVYYNVDGLRHRLVGCRGTLTLEVPAQDVPKWKFDLTGLYAAPTAAALPAVDWSGFGASLPTTPTNTPAFSLHGQELALSTLSVDLGNTVTRPKRVNQESIVIEDRKAAATLTVDEPPIGTQDLYTAMTARTRAALTLVHGTAAGNILTLAAPTTQITGLKKSEADGRSQLQLTLSLKPDDGDDEVSFAFT